MCVCAHAQTLRADRACRKTDAYCDIRHMFEDLMWSEILATTAKNRVVSVSTNKPLQKKYIHT